MILDYNYSKQFKKFEISYVKEDGNKGLFTFDNISRFKSFKSSENGNYTNWDGTKCDLIYTDKPSKFDIRNFILDLPEKYQKELHRNVFPNLYTFDIENKFVKGEKADAGAATGEITTISICSPKVDCIVIGTRPLNDNKWVEEQFEKYIKNIEFFESLELPMPKFRYIQFDSEKDMLEWFLMNIVSKVPVLSGWNCIMYDWRYIVNRIQNNYPELSIKLSSYTKQIHNKSFNDFKANKVVLPVPNHTFLVDMMDIIDQFDKVVMPLKESMKLDYIAGESMGIRKIEYDGDLMQLYNDDYDKYVYYNCIDSVLVQLINYKFKTLNLLYLFGLYCKEKIINTTSKIALTEALFANDFRDHNIQIVNKEKDEVPRTTLIGAYVKEPKAGKYKYVTCNDFASLYPSTIITCNISIENMLMREFTEQELEVYRKDPNYFVSVNGNVYRNDKEYAFKRIQRKLKSDRNVSKYLAKKLDAMVMLDLEHIKKNILDKMHTYDQQMINAIKKVGFDDIRDGNSLLSLTSEQRDELAKKLKRDIVYYESEEKAIKNLGNSMYGGSSHVSFFWFNMKLANDITGEARNLIHFMERHLSTFWNENWVKLTDLHKELGITVDPVKCKKLLCNDNVIGSSSSISYDPLIYGDSVDGNTLIKVNGIDIKIEDYYNKLNEYENWHNKDSKLSKDIIDTFYNECLIRLPIKRVIRHISDKQKWRIKTVTGKEVIVTNDHSLIVLRNGEKINCKPSELLKNDKLICIN